MMDHIMDENQLQDIETGLSSGTRLDLIVERAGITAAELKEYLASREVEPYTKSEALNILAQEALEIGLSTLRELAASDYDKIALAASSELVRFSIAAKRLADPPAKEGGTTKIKIKKLIQPSIWSFAKDQ